MGAATTFNTAVIQDYGGRIQGFQIQYWNGSTWATAYTGTKAANSISFPAVTSTQIRLNITKFSVSPSVWEFSVYNLASGGMAQSNTVQP